MGKSRRFAIRELKYLDKIFPQDMLTADRDPLRGPSRINQKVMKTLQDNGLIEHIKYPVKEPPKGVLTDVYIPKITVKGIEFLNGLRQKRTNTLLLILTILIAITSIFQIIILLTA